MKRPEVDVRLAILRRPSRMAADRGQGRQLRVERLGWSKDKAYVAGTQGVKQGRTTATATATATNKAANV